ncbi:hypothetical protein EJB05_47285, partial [Eragrostis curvula]
MDPRQTIRMNPGEGETSYARNSTFQSAEQGRMKPLIEEAITELCASLPCSMVIADLGCSCGPTALSLVSVAVDAICRQYIELEQPMPELSLLLNDLPSNDFNAVVNHMVAFRQRYGANVVEYCAPIVLISVVPGSFYERLFTTASMHLVLSSTGFHRYEFYTIQPHMLCLLYSEAPEELVKNGIPMYYADQQMWQKMRPIVLSAYAQQFRKDFMLFLETRAQETAPGGRMVLSLTGTGSHDPDKKSTRIWERVGRMLDNMASRDVIDKERLKNFYIPLHAPYENELKDIIEEQGSFSICKIEEHNPTAGSTSDLINPKMAAYILRAGLESIIVEHFGPSEEAMDDFVRTAEQHMSPAYIQKKHESDDTVFFALSLARKKINPSSVPFHTCSLSFEQPNTT